MAPLYKSLREQKAEIRLIVAKPGASPDPVSCSFNTVSLTETPTPTYDALSYTWGEDEISRESIVLDGQLFHVRPNLHAALQAIRNSTYSVVLWIDAICINQLDLGERARQVQIMRYIFANANRVLAWIGTLRDEHDGTAIDLMNTIILEPTTASPGEHHRGVPDPGNLRDKQLSCLYRFLSRPYWGRMWIVQELAVARECWVLCGPHWRPFSDYISLPAKLLPLMRLENLENSASEEAAYLAGTLTFTQMIDAVCHFRDNNCEIDLRSALEFLSGHVCSDPRDKVYAILGLCGEATQAALVPDYSETMTLVKLHRRVVEHCMYLEGNLTALAGPRHFATRCDGLPSWCPRFDDIDQWLAKDPLDLRGPGLAHLPSIEFIDQSESASTKLMIRGYRVDGISALVDIYEPDITLDSPVPLPLLRETVKLTLKRVATCVQQAKSYYQNSNQGSNAKVDDDSRSLEMAVMSTFSWLLYSEEDPPVSEFFQDVASTRLRRNRMFVTERGLVGAGPVVFNEGDLVCVLYGMSLPVVLRPAVHGAEAFLFLGDCYLYDMFEGQKTSKDGPWCGEVNLFQDFIIC